MWTFEIITHGLVKHKCLYTWTFKRLNMCCKNNKISKNKVLWNKSFKNFSYGLLNGQN